MILKKEYIRIIRFGAVGVLNTAVDFLVFAAMSGLFHTHYSISQVAAYSAGTLNSFLLNKYWTFEKSQDKKEIIGRQLVKFVIINLISLWVTVNCLDYLVGTLGLNLYIAKMLVILLSLVINYLGNRFWVFTD